MGRPPTGTVTFLFSDIEGSTRRWEHQQAAMRAALMRHDAILRGAIEGNGGHVFKTVGDAFCAAFATAPQALDAALAAQCALHAEDWGEIGPLGVRIALHTGVAEERNGDYFGPTLNRVARLLAAGHGGQILLSSATHELVRDRLPAGAELRDLGEHRLRDLERPEHIYQVALWGLPADFPPLRSLAAYPTNLAAQPTPLVGRQQEVADITRLLRHDAARLVTLTGPGGTGKTRLATAVGEALREDFPGGVFFVDLAPVVDPALVLPSVCATLGVKEAPGWPLQQSLSEILRSRAMLLILDNFEQVLPAAPVVAGLLGRAPALRVLVTSRTALRLGGEREYLVPPLALPERATAARTETLAQYPAVQLFIERARANTPDFVVTNATAPAIAEICQRLDGLPLAIELSAARTRVLTPHALLARLERRLSVLTGGARDLPARQRTLRDAIDWSYGLIAEPDQVLFRRVAVFTGSCTLEAVEAVCGAEAGPGVDILDGLTCLVDNSLLGRAEGPEDEPRFRMLETIREYALDRLRDSSEAELLRDRHAEFYRAMAERAAAELAGPSQGEWLARLEVEHDNLRGAIHWATTTGAAETALRLAGALWPFWYVRGHLSEGRAWLEAVLEMSGGSPLQRAVALSGAGILALAQGDRASASTHLEEALALRREAGDRSGVAGALNALGNVAFLEGDVPGAHARYTEALALGRELGDRRRIAYTLSNLASVTYRQGDAAAAEALYAESLSLLRAIGDTRGVTYALAHLGTVAHARGDESTAAARFTESLPLQRALGDIRGVAASLEGLAAVAGAEARPARAARLLGAAGQLREAIGAPLPPDRHAEYERTVTAARALLGEEAFAAAFEEGRALSVDAAVALALEQTELADGR